MPPVSVFLLVHRVAALGLIVCAVLAWSPIIQAASPAAATEAVALDIPHALRENMNLSTAPLHAVTVVPRATGLATIAAGSSADSRVVISAPVAGIVGAALPNPGQSVSVGTVLARLSSPQLAQLQAAAQMAAARLRQAEQTVARDKNLLADGLIAAKRWQASQAEWESAQAADRAARAELALAGGTESGTGTDLAVTAAVPGVIARRLVQPGSRVNQGEPLFELSTAGQWWLLALPPAQVPAQIAGATMRIEGCPDAPVRTVDATVDPSSQLVTLRAEPATACVALRPGQRVAAGLWVPTDAPVYEVPVAALSARGSDWQVFVRRGDGLMALIVKEIAASPGVSFVQGAFKPDDALVVAGANRLKAIVLGMGAQP